MKDAVLAYRWETVRHRISTAEYGVSIGPDNFTLYDFYGQEIGKTSSLSTLYAMFIARYHEDTGERYPHPNYH